MGLRLMACYAVLLGLGLWSDAATLDTAGTSGAASASGSDADAWVHVVGLFSVGLRMMMPCFITGAYAFSTTRVSEFVCALRRMRVPESVAIPCMVVIRFFPTIGRDYQRTRDAMALRGLASGRLALLRHPAQSLEFVLVPLLMNATIVSRDLSVAALAKGLGRPGRHTCITEIHSVGLIGRRWRSLSHLHFQYASDDGMLLRADSTLRKRMWYPTMCTVEGTLRDQCDIVRTLHKLPPLDREA